MVADPVENLIADAVLYRLDTPALADTLAGRSSADERTQALTAALDQAQDQLEELSLAYAARDITMREWLSAKKPITGRLETAQRQLAKITRTDALHGLVGNGDTLSRSWKGLDLSQQVAIIQALVDHAVIGPGTPGARSLDPSRVSVVWRH